MTMKLSLLIFVLSFGSLNSFWGDSEEVQQTGLVNSIVENHVRNTDNSELLRSLEQNELKVLNRILSVLKLSCWISAAKLILDFIVLITKLYQNRIDKVTKACREIPEIRIKN